MNILFFRWSSAVVLLFFLCQQERRIVVQQNGKIKFKLDGFITYLTKKACLTKFLVMLVSTIFDTAVAEMRINVYTVYDTRNAHFNVTKLSRVSVKMYSWWQGQQNLNLSIVYRVFHYFSHVSFFLLYIFFLIWICKMFKKFSNFNCKL